MENSKKTMPVPGSSMTKKASSEDGITVKIMPGAEMVKTKMPGAKMTSQMTAAKTSMPTPKMGVTRTVTNGKMQNGETAIAKASSTGKMPEFKMDKQQLPLSSLVEKQKASAGQPKVIVPLYKEKAADKTGAPPAMLTYGNGALLTNVEVYTIFWGAAWNQSPQTDLLTQINQFFDMVLTSQLIDLLGQYSVPGKIIGHGSRIGSFTNLASEPGGNGQVSDAQLQQEIQTLLANGSIPAATANTLYFVYLPPNVTLTGPAAGGGGTSCVDFCGYHWFIAGTNPEVYYAAMPFPGCNGCLGGLTQIQSLTSVSSHELCESITDPHPWTGWNSSQGEIGDICAWQTDVIAGYTVQKEWSNRDGMCTIGTPAPAPWSGWASLGGWIDMLTVGQNQDGRMEVFARGGDGAVWHNWQTAPNGNWSGWASLGGWIDMLTVGQNQDGRMEVFARGGDGAVWHNWQTAPNGNWSGWASLGGWIDILTVGKNQDGRMEIFARGGDGAVWHNWQTAPNGNWSGWASLGGWIDRLVVGQNADGRLELFARGSDAAIWHNWQTEPNGNWSGWASLGGWIDMLAVSQNADGRMELFARGSDAAVWHLWQTEPNGNWSDWASLGGWIDMLTVEQNLDGRMEIFVRGSDSAVWHMWQTAPSNGWSGWDSLGGWIDRLSVSHNLDGRIEVFARGGDGAVWHNWQTAPNF